MRKMAAASASSNSSGKRMKGKRKREPSRPPPPELPEPATGVALGEALGVSVGVGEGTAVGVGVGTAVGVGVGAGWAWNCPQAGCTPAAPQMTWEPSGMPFGMTTIAWARLPAASLLATPSCLSGLSM